MNLLFAVLRSNFSHSQHDVTIVSINIDDIYVIYSHFTKYYSMHIDGNRDMYR
jgi:hypothetical protein